MRPESPAETCINGARRYVKGAGNLPFGKTKTPFSTPDAIALLSCVFCELPISSLYCSSTNLNKQRSQEKGREAGRANILLDLGP